MKTIKLIRIPALILMLAVGACSKKDNDAPVATADVSTDDAATIMANSLSSNSGGMVSASADVALNTQVTFNANPGCGGTKTYSFTHQNPQGSATTYSYSFNYTYTLNCVNSMPDNVSSSAASTGSFDGPNLTSSDTGSSTFTVGGLSTSATAYTLNGEYKRTGSFTRKTGNKATGNSSVDIVVNNLMVNKTGSVASGGATYTLSGTSAKGAFSFTGTITFIANNQANVVVNGTTYLVDLTSGSTIKQ